MAITLHEAVDSDLAVVLNLVPYYIYDMSEYFRWACTADGRFDGCNKMPTYWSEAGKHAFMLKSDHEWAGFAMVRGNHEEDHIDFSMAEFFVLRKFRRQGVGEQISRQLFDLFRGRWLVEQLVDNTPAVDFWRKVIGRYAEYAESRSNSEWGATNQIWFNSDKRQPGLA